MAASADLIVNIVTKMSGAGMAQAEKQTSKFKSGLNKASVGAGVALGAIVAFGKGAVDAASDTEQAIGSVESVFGKQASKVEEFSKTSAKHMGLASSAYLNYAALVGGALQNAGFSAKDSVGKSNSLMQRAADLAATYGGTTTDAVSAINAAISRGEFDPLEKYNVSLNATSVNAEIAAKESKKYNEILSKQADEHGKTTQKQKDAAKAQSTLTGQALKHAKAQIAMKQIYGLSGKAAGQYAREQDSAAGSAQTAAAEFENMQSTLGTALLPVVSKVSTAIGKLAATMAKHKTTTQIVIAVIAAMAVAIIALNLAVTIYTAVTTLAASATIAAWVAAALPIVLVIAAVLAVVAVVVILWKKSETFRAIVLAVWGAIKAGAAAMGRALVGAWQKVSGAAQTMARVVRNVWNAIRSAAAAVATFVRNLWRGVWSAIAGFVRAYFNTYKAIFNTIRSVTSSVMSAIRDIAANAFSAVKGHAQAAVESAVNVFRGLPGKVKAAFSGAASLLYGIGGDIIHGLVQGIESAAHLVESAVSSIVNKIPSKVRHLMGISSPSKVMRKIGRDIMRGMEVGMSDGLAGVRKVSAMAVDTITKTIKSAAKKAAQGKRLARAAVRSIADETAALEKNARKRQPIYDAMAKQTAALKAQKDAWDQLKSSVGDTAKQFGSFAGAVGGTISDLVADMASRVAKVQLFQQTMAALAKLKLNKTTLSELAQAGPENALERAQALLAGGQSAVGQVNQLQSQLTQAANQLGTQTADAMYQTGIDATQALLDGLVADKRQLEKAADRLARNLAAAVRKALRKYTPATGGKGGKSASAASYAAPALASPMARGTAPAAAGGATVVNIYGAVDPEGTARQVRRILAGHDRRVGLRVS